MSESANEYEIVIRIPSSEGTDFTSDRAMAYFVEQAVAEGLNDRFVERDHIIVRNHRPTPRLAALPVGTKVVVTPQTGESDEPFAARVHGYSLHRDKYRLDREWGEDRYDTGGHTWAFANQVELHPDEDPASAAEPEPVVPELAALFERRWRCGVVASGFHNGALCSPSDPHDNSWDCGWRFIAPPLTDAHAARLGLPGTENTENTENTETKEI